MAPGTLKKRVDRVSIARYAAASGDFNPLHLDDDHARRHGMPSVIAHGLLTFGWVGHFLTDYCDGDPGRIRSMRVRFLKPVLPGDQIEVRGTITDEAADTTTLEIHVARDDELVASGSALVSR
jgi:acyl dehydratase